MGRCRRIAACRAAAGRRENRIGGRENQPLFSFDALRTSGLRCRSLRGFGPGGEHSGRFFGTNRDGGSRKAATGPGNPGAAHRLRPGRSSKASAGRARRESAPPGATGAVPYISRLRRRRGSPRRRWTGEPREGRGSGQGSLGVFRIRFPSPPAAVSPPTKWEGWPRSGRGGSRDVRSLTEPLGCVDVSPVRPDPSSGWGSPAGQGFNTCPLWSSPSPPPVGGTLADPRGGTRESYR